MGDKRYPNMAADKLGEGVEVNYDRIGPQNDLIVSLLGGFTAGALFGIWWEEVTE